MARGDRVVVVVRESSRDDANAGASRVDPNGANTFESSPLEAVGSPGVIVAYWCGWHMTPGKEAEFRSEISAIVGAGNASVFNMPPETPESILASTGLQELSSR